MENENWKLLRQSKSYGSLGVYGVQINVIVPDNVDIHQEVISNASYTAAKLMKEALLEATKAADPQTPIETKNNEKLLDLFKESIFVDRIPNEYCSAGCCKHLPWFIVTTRFGRIKIGWRKRVINIDWEDSIIDKTAWELFPDEDVTKFKKGIHAWDLRKAQEYINILLKDKNK